MAGDLLGSSTSQGQWARTVAGCASVLFRQARAALDYLGVRPGSVTPLALINDEARKVRPVLDEKMLRNQLLNVHPLENTATTTLSSADLLKFMAVLGYEPKIIDLDLSLTA